MNKTEQTSRSVKTVCYVNLIGAVALCGASRPFGDARRRDPEFKDYKRHDGEVGHGVPVVIHATLG